MKTKPFITQKITPVAGGHMQYEKYLTESKDGRLFVKKHSPLSYTDTQKAERSLTYLQKECAVMSDLRSQGFRSLPSHSRIADGTLMMEAFHSDDGWYWRAPANNPSAYIEAAIQMFDHLESAQHSTDYFDIEASMESIRKEGWFGFTKETYHRLDTLFKHYSPRLKHMSLDDAEELHSRLHELHSQAVTSPLRDTSVIFSHHDARQSNIAWHPEHGMRLVDWSWAGYGEPGSDITNLLIDLHKSGHDISMYHGYINKAHCLTLIGFLLGHATWPTQTDDDSVRFQQFTSAISAYQVMNDRFKHS